MTYREFCNFKSNDPMENIFPKGTEPDEAMDILETTFIGELTFAPYTDVVKTIINKCKKHHKYNLDNLGHLNAQEAVDTLRLYLLPKDWYIFYVCGYSQANTEIVGEILRIYNNPDVKLINRIKAYFKNKKK